MPFDGSGNFNRTDGNRTGSTTWAQARDAGALINAPDADHHDQDIANGPGKLRHARRAELTIGKPPDERP